MDTYIIDLWNNNNKKKVDDFSEPDDILTAI